MVSCARFHLPERGKLCYVSILIPEVMYYTVLSMRLLKMSCPQSGEFKVGYILILRISAFGVLD